MDLVKHVSFNIVLNAINHHSHALCVKLLLYRTVKVLLVYVLQEKDQMAREDVQNVK